MDISEVAKASGMSASTLRYYEEKGLIKSIGRRGIRRIFEAKVVEQLALIALGRSAGFSLDEIGQMFAPDGSAEINRELLTEKANELDRTIKKLTSLRNGLRHAADCPAEDHLQCSKFQRLMSTAVKLVKQGKLKTNLKKK